jgi:hypothetical protein
MNSIQLDLLSYVYVLIMWGAVFIVVWYLTSNRRQ